MDAKDHEGTQGHGLHGLPRKPGYAPVPRPSQPPARPPAPAHAPSPPAQTPPMSEVERWLRVPRVVDAPGVYGYGHVPRKPDSADGASDGRVLANAVVSFLGGALFWSLCNNGAVPLWHTPLAVFDPSHWFHSSRPSRPEIVVENVFVVAMSAVIALVAAKLGDWAEAGRRFLRTPPLRAGAALAVGLLVWQLSWVGYVPIHGTVLSLLPPSWVNGGGDKYRAAAVTYTVYTLVGLLIAWPCAKYGDWPGLARHYGLRLPVRSGGRGRPVPAAPSYPPLPAARPAQTSPADWPELRAAGRSDAADRLADEVRLGRMNDVDYVRISSAWKDAGARPQGVTDFTDDVRSLGAAAFTHPSGERDLPTRVATHDLLGGQVRIGRGLPDKRNGYQYREAGIALDPGVLGTGLLVVGPPRSGKTRRVMRPVVESLCLQALTGSAAVIAVGGADSDLGPHDAYDVVISPGDPSCRYSLDLYGGTTDPDIAARLLAEALIDGPEAEQRNAGTALGQLLGPYAAAHGRFPSVPDLRELLDGAPDAYAQLRRAVEATGAAAGPLLRELDARQRRLAQPGDIGSRLADRIALLDRPAFATSFGDAGGGRPFTMDALAHPVRVRVELPEWGHAEASRVLVRLLLAQFTLRVRKQTGRSRFACLVVDDAGHAVTAGTVRALATLPAARAGVVLGLRTLNDVPEELRGPLVSAAGCRMALAGVSPWDAQFFSESWGTTQTQTREVTRADRSGDLSQRTTRLVRRLVTNQIVTADSVTVREVERERWSASDLAHTVPAGHAVVSLTTVRGEYAAPVLLDLRD